MIRAYLLAFAMFCAVSALAGPVRADDVTEAGALFASGNEHFQTGMRARGARRTRELEAALDDYFASLRLVRSRNVLYNAALVLEQLERWEDAFNYWTEYGEVDGLSEEEHADGEVHRDALRPRVSVARIESEPSGAEVWIDRRDLSARGHTPLEIALPAGDHGLWLVLRGWEETQARIVTTIGTTEAVSVPLVATPVMVQVLAPDARLLLDGEEIPTGTSLPVPPGAHVLTLEIDGRAAIERRFEVVPDSAPMVIDLTTAVATLTREVAEGATLRVASTTSSRVMVDGVLVASGLRLEVPVAAGEREITVEPAVGPAWRGTHAFHAGDLASLSLSTHATSGGILAGRGLAGSFSILGLLASGGLSAAARLAHDDYRARPTESQYETVNALNLAADLSWGVTAAVGVVAILLLVIDDAGTTGSFAEEGEGE